MDVPEMINKFAIRRMGDKLAVFARPTPAEAEIIRAAKPEIMAELVRRETEATTRKAAEQTKIAEERRAIRAGEIKIAPSWTSGEYLSGWQVYGEIAEALEEIGVAKYISGWGSIIDQKIIDALGKEFTYSQAVEYSRPARDAAQAKQKAKDEARQAKFTEAKTTGKKVVLRSWSEDCNDPREQCSTDDVTEYAMPDGTTKIERQHTW